MQVQRPSIATRFRAGLAAPRVRSIEAPHESLEHIMISRLTVVTATIIALAAGSLALASSAHREGVVASSAAKQTRVVQLETVVITAKRLPQEAAR